MEIFRIFANFNVLMISVLITNFVSLFVCCFELYYFFTSPATEGLIPMLLGLVFGGILMACIMIKMGYRKETAAKSCVFYS